MADTRKITPQELPKLIAAAVEKALSEKPITAEQLANLSKFPIRCGIFPYETGVAVGAAESKATTPVLGHRPLPFGFVLREFDLLVNPAQLRPLTGTEEIG